MRTAFSDKGLHTCPHFAHAWRILNGWGSTQAGDPAQGGAGSETLLLLGERGRRPLGVMDVVFGSDGDYPTRRPRNGVPYYSAAMGVALVMTDRRRQWELMRVWYM